MNPRHVLVNLQKNGNFRYVSTEKPMNITIGVSPLNIHTHTHSHTHTQGFHPVLQPLVQKE